MKTPLLPLHITLPQSAATCLIMLVCAAFGAGCAFPTYKAYNGLEQPTSEIVTIQDSSRFAFWSMIDLYSVDDQRVPHRPPDILSRSKSVAVLPGAHWYQVFVVRRSLGFPILDIFLPEAICGFRLEAAPGTAYKLVDVDNGGQEPANGRKIYKASMEIEERFATQKPIVRHIPVECVCYGYALCQTNTDCNLAKGYVCVRENGYSYGICAKP